MRFDFVSERIDEIVKNEVRTLFGSALPGRSAARLHPDVPTALNEGVRGLARLFPHKKALAVVKGSGPWFDPLVVFMATEGYQIQEIPFAETQSGSTWISTLNKDCLMVLHGVDDPITSRILEKPDWLNALQEKKIFSVAVSNAHHHGRPPQGILSHQLRILSGGNDGALLVVGDRASRIESLVVGIRPSRRSDLEFLRTIFAESVVYREKIETFEKKGWGGSQTILVSGDERVWDRAVLYWNDLDGSAVIDTLATKLKWTLSDPGEEPRLESVSLCRWGGLSGTKWLREQGYTPEQLRGLVIISGKFADEELGKALAESVASVRQLMG